MDSSFPHVSDGREDCKTQSVVEVGLQPETLGQPLVPPQGSVRMLLPLYVVQLGVSGTFEGASVLGELYGVRWAPDALAASESVVDSYILFPDVNRVEWHSFMAIGDE